MADQPARHGVLVRGQDLSVRSQLFEGRFGRLFRQLPPAEFGQDESERVSNLNELALRMTAPADIPEKPDQFKKEENAGISAGYTYLGQFIDHDLTFDPVSSLDRQSDPESLVDFRTPRFDLDSVYGRGPRDQPYLYEKDGILLRLGRRLSGNRDRNARDLPRIGDDAVALTGDPRNDENFILSQLHVTFLRFHNAVANRVAAPNRKANKVPSVKFEEVQRLVRWHYQWIVLHDFLKTILNRRVYDRLLPHIRYRTDPISDPPQLRFYDRPEQYAYIPVEFSAAAFRFGHSMIRPVYRLNKDLSKPILLFQFPGWEKGAHSNKVLKRRDLRGRSALPTGFKVDLKGGRLLPTSFAIDWDLFFGEMKTEDSSRDRVQPAYKIDVSLVHPLNTVPRLPEPTNLALRNLRRGVAMQLPSGQAVARTMGFEPLADEELLVPKKPKSSRSRSRAQQTEMLSQVAAVFVKNAPLWFYILAECRRPGAPRETPVQLGNVGSTIVGETIVRLMLEDGQSFLNQEPHWRPTLVEGGDFTIQDLIRIAREA